MDLWAKLHPNAITPPSAPTEYPKWVAGKIVHSRAEEADLTGEELPSEDEMESPAVPNVLMQLPQPVYVTPREGSEADPEKTALQLEASRLGIEIDRRWGVKKLRHVIQEHR